MFQLDAKDGGNIPKTYQKYCEEWEREMNQAFEIANKHKNNSGKYNKRYYDRKVQGVEIEIGDRVLLRNHEKGGTGKLRSHWEDRVYVVVAKDKEIPVVTIKPEEHDENNKERRVHRNQVMKCNSILPKQEVAVKEKVKGRRKAETSMKKEEGRRDLKKGKQSEPEQKKEVETVSSDSEDDILIIRSHHHIAQNRLGTNSKVSNKETDIEDVDEKEDDGNWLERNEEIQEDVETGDLSIGCGGTVASGESSVSEGEEENTTAVRQRSQRAKCKPKVFTYDKIGGVPTTTYRK